MNRKLSLNTITIRNASLAEKLQAAAKAGFQGVGLWADELREEFERGRAARTDILRAIHEGLVVAEVCALGGWMWSEGNARRDAMEEAMRRMEIAANIGSECIIACVSGGEGDSSQAADDFRELCERAEEFEIKVALEFLGGARQINNVASALEIVDLASHRLGGVVIDVFHLHKGGGSLSDLKYVPSNRLFLVHIDDALDLPREELQDRHRMHVGTGALPLTAIVGPIESTGYEGFYSLELFNPDYWEMDPGRVAREGMDAIVRFFDEYERKKIESLDDSG